jgi:hypothetical protein
METKRLKLEIRNHLNTACRTRIIKSKQKIPKKKKKTQAPPQTSSNQQSSQQIKTKIIKKKKSYQHSFRNESNFCFFFISSDYFICYIIRTCYL